MMLDHYTQTKARSSAMTPSRSGLLVAAEGFSLEGLFGLHFVSASARAAR